MRYSWILAAMLMLPVGMPAQSAIPAGTLIPIQIVKGFNAHKAAPGQQIRARVMQDIPGTYIRKGAQLLGQVVTATPAKNGTAKLEFRFGQVKTGNGFVTLSTDLRALASPPEVEDAETGSYGPDGGIAFEQEDTDQIGGEHVYGRRVMVGSKVVATATRAGVVGEPRAALGLRCRGAVDGNSQPQALWLFSSNACGVYGFTTISIEHAGRTDPTGDIVLESSNGKLNVNSGSGMLLRVRGS